MTPDLRDNGQDGAPPWVPPTPETAPIPAARTLRLAWWLIGAIIVADQVTKWLVVRSLPVYDSFPVVPGMLDIVHIHNRGVAFGIMNDSDHPLRGGLTTALAFLALGGIVYYATHLAAHERWARIGLSLVLGGAIGNLIDRARQGYVVDFVDAYWRDWHFWAFNVADAAISIGAFLIVVELLFFPDRHASQSCLSSETGRCTPTACCWPSRTWRPCSSRWFARDGRAWTAPRSWISGST